MGITDSQVGIDAVIKMGIDEAKERRGEACFLIISPLGSMILKERLGLEDTMEIPKYYMNLEILYTVDQYAEVARVH